MEHIHGYISRGIVDTIDSICGLFREVDAAADRFRARTGLRCPERCGECCLSSRVETTVVEMLPLAMELWRREEAEIWLERIAEAAGKTTCVFFQADPGCSGAGRCSVYEMRPLICRLFGFFTVRNKYGRYAYGSCSVMKKEFPGEYQKAVMLLDEMDHPSLYTDYFIRIIGMDSGFGFRMEPVNRAAEMALCRMGYQLELSGFVKN